MNISDEGEAPRIDFEILHHNTKITTFHVGTKVANESIELLIAKGKAKYCLEMDCPKAFYRDAFLNNEGEFTIQLQNNRFNGKVLSTLSVVATEDINNYKNQAFDSFYNSFEINIGAGETLAFLGSFELHMEEKSKDVKNLADDFLEVVKDENLKYSRFDLGGDKISLKLPSDMYDMYHNPLVSENNKYESFLHASFLLNVLTYALQNMGQYNFTKWAESLHDRIETEDELRDIALAGSPDGDIFDDNGNLSNPEITLDLAQAILANPYDRMFKGFENFYNREDD